MKDNKPTFIKLGNLVFNADGAKEMSYKQFMDTYTDVLKGYDVKKAAKELGIKMPKKVVEEDK
jgi:hypothetical protein